LSVEKREEAVAKDSIESARQNVAEERRRRFVGTWFHAGQRYLEVDAFLLGDKGAIENKSVDGANILADNTQRNQLH
jgi:hypothetical protein